MKPEVQCAIDEIGAAFPSHAVVIRDDDEGGAYIIVDTLDPGAIYQQQSVWIGCRITFQYPYADVYPHFVDASLSRVDGRPLGEGMSPVQPFEGRPAIQISRRTNHPDPRFETAARKLLRILAWLAAHP